MPSKPAKPITLLPWKFRRCPNGWGYVADDVGNIVLGDGDAGAVQHMPHIVRAVNAYPELVVAAKVAVEALRRYASIAPDEVARQLALQDMEVFRGLLNRLGEG